MQSCRRLLLLVLTSLCCNHANAVERDYLGWPFAPRTFPPCVRYGCTFSTEPPASPAEGGTVHVQLKKFDAHFDLYLAPDKSVMALYVVTPGRILTNNSGALLQRAINRSANQEFDPSMLPRCLKKAASRLPAVGNAERRSVILKQNHYGVHCVSKRWNGQEYVGALVYFDL